MPRVLGERGGDDRDRQVRIGRPFGLRVDLDDLDARLLHRLDGAELPCAAVLLVKRPEHERDVSGLEPGALDRLDAERVALLGLLGADIAAAELRHDLRHRHVLIHHLDAGLRGFLGERHDRGVAGMAHHRDAVRLDGDRLAQLLDHLLDVPAGEDVVDGRPEVVLGLLGAVVDDGAEGVALRAADEEAQVDALAPFVARIGACRRRRCGQRERTCRRHQGSGQREGGRALSSDCHCVNHWLSSRLPQKRGCFRHCTGL